MLLKIINSNGNNLNNYEKINIKQLCNSYIKNKYTKIVRHKKIIPITHKLPDIHVNL